MDSDGEFDLEQFIPYRLSKAAERASHEFSAIYRQRYSMTRPEWRVLANLGQHGTLTATVICQLSNQHKTKVSRAVSSLEGRRWVERRQNDHDRREAYLLLTAAGREAYLDLTRWARRFDQNLAERLGRKGMAALEQALAALEEEADRESPVITTPI